MPDDTPVLTSNVDALKSDKDGYEIVKEAMDHPIDSPHLYELAKGKPDCTIIISDHTRPVPSQDILPHMIRELRCGNPDIKITLLVATGFHRPTTVEELKGKLGDALYEEFKDNIVVHDAHDPSKNIKVGNLPSGPDCIIDKVAYNASLLVAEGFIEAHFFAGFSGGRKSVLPGICDAVTVMGNHCGEFIASPYARTGILDKNPIHEDMVAAAEMAKLAFICNVVIDKQLVQMRDKEEESLLDNLIFFFHELDRHVAISSMDAGSDEVFNFEIASTSHAMAHSQTYRLPEKQKAKAKEISQAIEALLTGDSNLDVCVLLKMLNEKLAK